MAKEALRCSPADRRRISVLILSASLLSVAIAVTMLSSLPNKAKAWLVAAVLVPAVQNGFALLHFDAIQSSFAVERQSDRLLFLSIPLTAAMFVFTVWAEVSAKVWLLICCVFIIWGGLFELGLGLATALRLPLYYWIYAFNIGTSKMMPPESETSVLCWALTTMTEEEKPLFLAIAFVPLALAVLFTIIQGLVYWEKLYPADPVAEGDQVQVDAAVV